MAGYAQEHIMYTMYRLMEQKPLDDITVKEITEAGPVNRKTFYFHFHGIEDLLKWMIGQRLSNIPLLGADSVNWKGKMRQLIVSLEADKDFFYAIFNSRYAEETSGYLKNKLRPAIINFVRNCSDEMERASGQQLYISDKHYGYINEYYLNGAFSLVMNWLQTGCSEQTESFLDIIDNLTKNTIFNVLEAFSSAEN